MNKNGKIALVMALAIVVLLVVGLAIAKPGARASKQECRDRIDNDGDGAVDMADGGCDSKWDNDETNCGDGVCEGGETSANCVADCGYPDSCSDSDGGNYSYVFGTTSGYYNNNQYSNDDYCVDASNIMEYYCSGDYEQSQQQSCGTDGYGYNYCMNGSVYHDYTDYYCSGGECDNNVASELVQTCEYGCTAGVCDPAPDSCSDTDGGFIESLIGTVSGFFSGSSYSNTDYCIDSTTLVEHYCSGNYAYSANVSCTGNYTGCTSGACY